MTGERVQLLNPDPVKHGVTMDAARYQAMRAAIVGVLADAGPNGVQFMDRKGGGPPDFYALVKERIGPDWEGSVGWHATAVKLDLEARGELERIPGAKPQRVRLPQK